MSKQNQQRGGQQPQGQHPQNQNTGEGEGEDAEAAQRAADLAAAEADSDNHVAMLKDGAEIPVHTTNVRQHELLGWKVKG
jgi:hypothetical protein